MIRNLDRRLARLEAETPPAEPVSSMPPGWRELQEMQLFVTDEEFDQLWAVVDATRADGRLSAARSDADIPELAAARDLLVARAVARKAAGFPSSQAAYPDFEVAK